MNFKQRILTKPGYKFLFVISMIIAAFYVLSLTQPIIEVNSDNMVISVDGVETYRPVMSWDLREAKIVRVR